MIQIFHRFSVASYVLSSLHLLLPLYIHILSVDAFANVAHSCVALSVLSHFIQPHALLLLWRLIALSM